MILYNVNAQNHQNDTILTLAVKMMGDETIINAIKTMIYKKIVFGSQNMLSEVMEEPPKYE